MTEEYLDISCPICGKRDMAGWIDNDDVEIIMCCERCDKIYAVFNDGSKVVRDD